MSNANPTILAIDPGTEKLGISLMNETGPMHCWYIKIAKDDLAERYKAVFSAICDILNSIKIEIDYYTIETPFFGRNIATTIKLGTVRGIIIASIFRRNRDAKIVDINPVEVRNHFGLKKGAKKNECHEFLLKVFRANIEKEQLHEDVLDSLGIGLAALSKIKRMKQNAIIKPITKHIKRRTSRCGKKT